MYLTQNDKIPHRVYDLAQTFTTLAELSSLNLGTPAGSEMPADADEYDAIMCPNMPNPVDSCQ